MKKTGRSRMRVLAAGMALVFAVALLSACGAKKVNVTIVDRNITTEAEASTDQTVQEVLDAAGIKLSEKDKVSPERDIKISDSVTEIKISRYAKVSIIDGENSIEVELVGATVADALKTAGIILGPNDSLDCKEEDYLTDGMAIHVEHKKSVTVEADGNLQTVTTPARTVGEVLAELKIALGEGDTVQPSADTVIHDGDHILVTRFTSAEGGSAQTPEQAGGYDPGYAAPTNTEPAPAAERTEVSRVAYPNCADGSHGYYEVTYSDGSVEYIVY